MPDLNEILGDAPVAPSDLPVILPGAAVPKALLVEAGLLMELHRHHQDLEAQLKLQKLQVQQAMEAAGITEVPVSGYKLPIKLQSGQECRPPSLGLLKKLLGEAQATEVWNSTEKDYKRLSLPKLPAQDEPDNLPTQDVA